MSRKTFWDKSKINVAKKVLKESGCLREATEKLSKLFNRKIDKSTLHRAMTVYGNMESTRSLTQGMTKRKWSDSDLSNIKSILRSSDNTREAIIKIQKVFGNDVTYNTIRSALVRYGHNGELSSYTASKSAKQNGICGWNDKNIEQAVEILNKHRSMSSAINEMKGKMGVPVSYERLGKRIKEKYGPFANPGDFLATSKKKGLADGDSVSKLILVIKKNKKKKMSLRDLCNDFDCSPVRMESLISDAKACGYSVDIGEDGLNLNTDITTERVVQKINIPGKAKKEFRIGVISDTHFGSQACLVKESQHFINAAYDEFGVRTFLHAGDILAGDQVYRGQIAELDHWGCQKQCQAAADALPKRDGLEYWGILGNHDVSFVKNAGIDVGKVLESMRPDFHCIGQLKQKIVLNGVEVELAHLKSSAHARSYSLEKHVYRTVSMSNQPKVIFCGHRHTNGYFEVQRIHNFLVPCFEDVSMFLKYNDMMPSVGGIIVDFFLDDNNDIIRLVPQFHLYHQKDSTEITVNS